MTELICDGPADAPRRFAFAHGAGAGMDSTFMQAFARGLAADGVRVARFEFPYMARRRLGLRAALDRPPVLLQAWRDVVAELGDPRHLFIGGKSMGGRIASMVADELGVAGLVCLGYPFHPPSQPARLRTAHLTELRTRTLIVQGTRDPFGSQAEVAGYALSSAIRLLWLPDGDHSFAPRKASGHSAAGHLAGAIAAAASFMRVNPAGRAPAGSRPGRKSARRDRT